MTDASTLAAPAGTGPTRGVELPDWSQLRPDVRKIRREGGHTLLVSPQGKAVRIGSAGDALLADLTAGAGPDRLLAVLSGTNGASPPLAVQLAAFLAQLSDSGLLTSPTGSTRPALTGSVVPPSSRRLMLGNPDRIVQMLAAGIRRIPHRLLAAAGIFGALAALAALTAWVATTGPEATDVVRGFSVSAVAVFIFAVVPLHEIGHAVACRWAGAPVKGAGLLLRRKVIPVPFVDCAAVTELADKRHRLLVPLAGPALELAVAAGAAALAVLGTGPVVRPASYLVLLCVLHTAVNLSPFTESDGSHAIEACLDDELARRAAFARRPSPLHSPISAAKYRRACVTYLVAFTLMVGWLVLAALV